MKICVATSDQIVTIQIAISIYSMTYLVFGRLDHVPAHGFASGRLEGVVVVLAQTTASAPAGPLGPPVAPNDGHDQQEAEQPPGGPHRRQVEGSICVVAKDTLSAPVDALVFGIFTFSWARSCFFSALLSSLIFFFFFLKCGWCFSVWL